MMDQRRIWRTKGIEGMIWELVMSKGMSARMATTQMEMSWKKHCKPMINQFRMWRTEGIVLESVKIGQYISDL